VRSAVPDSLNLPTGLQGLAPLPRPQLVDSAAQVVGHSSADAAPPATALQGPPQLTARDIEHQDCMDAANRKARQAHADYLYWDKILVQPAGKHSMHDLFLKAIPLHHHDSIVEEVLEHHNPLVVFSMLFWVRLEHLQQVLADAMSQLVSTVVRADTSVLRNLFRRLLRPEGLLAIIARGQRIFVACTDRPHKAAEDLRRMIHSLHDAAAIAPHPPHPPRP
jgi:hypothetical protein